MQHVWTDDEPGWAEARAEIARMHRRVKSRWITVAIITLLGTALLVGYQARKQRTYEAQTVVRVSEGDFDRSSAPPTSRQLQDYLWDAVLSRPVLLEVIKDNDLYPSKLRMDPNFAVDSMREDLDVKVVQNFFSQQRFSEDPPRTARMIITYSGRDPELTLKAVRRIAQLIAEREAANRELASEYAVEAASQTAEGMNAQLVHAQAEQARLRYELETAEGADAAELMVKLQGVQQSMASIQTALNVADTARSTMELRSSFEEHAMGLRFEVVDPGRIPKIVLTDGAKIALVGFLAFLFLLPVVGVGVGAYDLHVYDIEDLRRLGVEPFGHVPPFPGHRTGSLKSRMKVAMGASWKK